MARRFSQNGYTANVDSIMAAYTVPGSNVRVVLRKGDASVVLLWVLSQYHKRVEPLRQADTGGYAKRVIRGGVSLSNHASGTAVDARWQDHPLGRRGTFTAGETRVIRDILEFCEGVVRWGGDYKTRADEMHFEIVGTPAQLKRVADKIRNERTREVATPKKTSAKTSIKLMQAGLNRVFSSYSRLAVTGNMDAATTRVVKEFQRRSELKDDGVVGPKTKAALGRYGIKF